MKQFVLLFPIILVAKPSAAQMTLQTTTVDFASADEGRAILTREDDFVRRMSPFDRAVRMKSDHAVTQEEYLAFVGQQVLDWNTDERAKITSAWEGAQAGLRTLSLPLPSRVLLVKTTGNEESGAAYTRANAIVFPEKMLLSGTERIQRTLCHELFHVVSRTDPGLRKKLYATIGFEKCDELDFPQELTARKITNPDAPINDHFIRLQVEGQERLAIPILLSRTATYDASRAARLFDYLQFQFLLVERIEGSDAVRPVYDGTKPRTVGMASVAGYFEQVGRNTRYIIHPEEILADNFALLVLRVPDLATPSIVDSLKALLSARATAP